MAKQLRVTLQKNMVAVEQRRKRIKAALDVAYNYGTVDGGHHKMWVIDQMVRALTASDEAYVAWIREHNKGDYEWDEGVAP